VLIVFAGCCGCINKIKELNGGGDIQVTPEVTAPSLPLIPTTVPTPEETIVQVSPMKSDAVVEVTPYTTPNPYPIIHGVMVNSSPQYSFLERTPEFSKNYVLSGNGVGLLVNVVQGPLYIVYTVDPEYDCLKDPDSCRGTVLVSVNRPYMTITVRDNQTQEIIAQSGYGREYSSDTGNYEFTFSATSGDAQDTGALVSDPGPRYIAIYREGQFQITMQGNYLDVDLDIITGASPNPADLTDSSTGQSAVPTPEYIEE
jgi:hypothetical protein